MRSKLGVIGLGLLGLALLATTGWGEEAAGVVTGTGYGTVVLDDAGTSRQFNLSGKNTQYEPAMWRPAVGDKVSLVFILDGQKLVVTKIQMTEAGPSTPTDLKSPVAVEIIEVGKSGVRAQIASGHVVKFTFSRQTQKLPLGWVPVAGEKATVTYTVERGGPFGPGAFGVNYVVGKMEKLP